MLWNLVNRQDVLAVAAKARSDGPASIVRRFGRSRSARVRQAWSVEAGDDQWWAIDAVRRRWREKVCGRGDVGFPRFLCERHLDGRSNLDALMAGCGSGHSLPGWIDTGCFRRVHAFDVAPAQIARARERIATLDPRTVVQAEIADAATFVQPEATFDVVIVEQALHHLSPLDAIVGRLARVLRSGGVIFVDDFVGPRRHQWTRRQLAAANALLSLLPEPYRRMQSGRVKRTVVRPSVARMLLTDPSEAVESSRILPVLGRHFELLEVRGYGGTLLHVVLSGIAHNFVGTDADSQGLLEACFAFEDALLGAGELSHDFVVVVGRRPA
jgi:SAM-dependent methyltransferase